MAPSMREIEEQFKNQINFVVVDGSAEKNYDLVSEPPPLLAPFCRGSYSPWPFSCLRPPTTVVVGIIFLCFPQCSVDGKKGQELPQSE